MFHWGIEEMLLQFQQGSSDRRDMIQRECRQYSKNQPDNYRTLRAELNWQLFRADMAQSPMILESSMSQRDKRCQ